VSSRTSALTKEHAEGLMKEMKKQLLPLFEELAGVDSEERRRRGRELRKEFRAQQKEQRAEHVAELQERYRASWRLASVLEDSEAETASGSGSGSPVARRFVRSQELARELADERLKIGRQRANKAYAIEKKRFIDNVKLIRFPSIYSFHINRGPDGKDKSIRSRRQGVYRQKRLAAEAKLRGIESGRALDHDEYVRRAWPAVVELAAVLSIEARYDIFIEISRDTAEMARKKIPASVLRDASRDARADLYRDDFHRKDADDTGDIPEDIY